MGQPEPAKNLWDTAPLLQWLYTTGLSCYYKHGTGTFLVVQWLRLCALSAEGPGSTPGQGTRSHVSQLKGWTCTVHVADHTPVTWHTMHWSRGTHWRNPWTGAWWLQSMGLQRVGYDRATSTSNFNYNLNHVTLNSCSVKKMTNVFVALTKLLSPSSSSSRNHIGNIKNSL